MNIYLPWGAMLIIISLYLFREYNRVRRAKEEDRRERLNERRQELMDNLLAAKKKKVDPPQE
jgi:hypothetical protein